MKGARGGALLLAAAAIVVLLLVRDRAPPRDRVSRPHDVPPPAPLPVEPPPKPPDLPPPEAPPTEQAKPGARLVGRVTDEEGSPLAGAGIWLSEGMGPGEGEVVARTGEDGRYLYDGVDGEERLVGAIAAKYAPSKLEKIAPRTQTVFEIDFTLRRGGGTLAITVGDAEARIRVEPVFRGYPESLARRTLDVTGQVTIDGLLPEWNFVRVRAPGRAPQTLLTRLSPEGVVDANVQLGNGAVVFGTVHGPDGTPAPGARVDLAGWEWAELGVVADDAGAYRLEHAPVALVEIRAVAADGAEAWAFLKLEEGREVRWDPVVQTPGDIAGQVVDEGGSPLPYAAVSCWRVGSTGSHEFLQADKQGRFRIPGLPNREYKVAVWAMGVNAFGPPSAEVTAMPGGPPLTITVQRPRSVLRGTIVTGGGLPAADARVRTWPSGAPGVEVRAQAAADGRFRLGPLPAAAYFLEIHLDGEPTLHLDGIELKADEQKDLGVLRFPSGGRIRVRVVGEGEIEDDPRVRSLDGDITYTVRPDGEGVLSEDLVPGRYLVSGGLLGIMEEEEVKAGETTSVDLKLRASGILEAVALDASGARVGATFTITDAHGRPVTTDYGSPLLIGLASGPYTVTAVDANGARDTRDFEIPADGSKTRVALALR